MTDIKRYSLEEQRRQQQQQQAPRIPVHETNVQPLDIPPTPFKSVHRSKTVRNLNSAGSKMRGLFKSKNKEAPAATSSRRMTTSADENGFLTRPILSTSASYGPGSENILQHHQPALSYPHSNNNQKEEAQMYSEQIANEVDVNKLQQQQQVNQQAQQQQAQAQAQQQQQQQQQQIQQGQQQQQSSSPSDEVDQAQQQAQQQLHAQQVQQAQQQLQQQAQQQHLNFQHELEQLNELIAQRTAEVQQEKKTKERLQIELNEAQRVFKEREVEYSAIEHSFFEHTRAVRATDDDLSTIRDSFKLLKYSIARLIMTLNKKADKARAGQKFVATWPNLTIVDPTTGEMEPSFVNLLSEKLVHEHLVKNVFSAPIYPGLKVNDAYFALNNWLQAHNSQFSTRLRQQMAAVVAKSNKESEIQQAAQKEKQKIASKIYEDLADIYHPFLRENDAVVEEEKRYSNKICDIVDKALKLTIAIRGQEVEITTVGIEEGNKQQFEEETMTEVKGRSGGLVRFCICPTFMGGDREHGFLEKGKVVISG